MILGMEIGMIVVAVMTLATGKFTLSTNRVVPNPLAIKIALILLAPIPLAYTAHGFVHHYFVTHNKPVTGDSFTWTLIAVEGGITVLCLAVAYALGGAAAVDPKSLASSPAPEATKAAAALSSQAPPLEGAFRDAQFEREEQHFKEMLRGKPEPPPQAVCTGCCQPIRVAEGGRLPPWCPKCGKNL